MANENEARSRDDLLVAEEQTPGDEAVKAPEAHTAKGRNGLKAWSRRVAMVTALFGAAAEATGCGDDCAQVDCNDPKSGDCNVQVNECEQVPSTSGVTEPATTTEGETEGGSTDGSTTAGTTGGTMDTTTGELTTTASSTTSSETTTSGPETIPVMKNCEIGPLYGPDKNVVSPNEAMTVNIVGDEFEKYKIYYSVDDGPETLADEGWAIDINNIQGNFNTPAISGAKIDLKVIAICNQGMSQTEASTTFFLNGIWDKAWEGC